MIADAAACARALSGPLATRKEVRAAAVAAQFATGSVALPMMPSVDVLRPKRERLEDCLAAWFGYTDVAAYRRALARYELRWSLGNVPYLAPRAIAGNEHVRSVQADPSDPAQFWETLATRGVIPMEWVDDPRRRFDGTVEIEGVLVSVHPLLTDPPAALFARAYPATPDAKPGDPLRVGQRVRYRALGPHAHPATIAACLAFAADVPSVLTVEAIARETVRRAERVVWRVDTDYHAALMRDHQRVPAWWDPLHALGYAFGGSDDTSVTLVAPELGG